MTTHSSGATLSRRFTLFGLAMLATAALAAAGCGGDAAPAVCGSLETLTADINELQETDLEAGEGAVADVEASLDSIRADLEAVKTDAQVELAEPMTGLQSSIDALAAEAQSVSSAGEITAESTETLVDSVAAVSASLETLTSAIPNCD